MNNYLHMAFYSLYIFYGIHLLKLPPAKQLFSSLLFIILMKNSRDIKEN